LSWSPCRFNGKKFQFLDGGRARLITQPISAQAFSDFLLQYDNRPFFFVSELMDFLLTGEDQSQADQPNNLAEGHPMLSKLDGGTAGLISGLGLAG